MNYSIPDYKKPPKHMVEQAKAGRAKLRIAAHKEGKHIASPSTLCELCKVQS